MCSDEDSESGSHFSIMDFFQDFPLCCQDKEAVEAVFRPTTHAENSDREGITHGTKIMEKPWKPPRFRDTSLLADPRDAEESETPSSSPKTITPSVGVVSCDDSIPSRSVTKNDDDVSLPSAFVPPKNHLPRPRSCEFEAFSRQDQNKRSGQSVDNEDSGSLCYSKSQSSTSMTSKLTLGPKDVVCGRGAPTSIHPGNLDYKKTIKKHEMTYLCSTRSEKPKIALKLLAEFRARGVRFVKRERNHDGEGGFVWVEIGEQRSYEKICQSLREGAPQLRRQMMATEAKRMKATSEEKKENPKAGRRGHQKRQQREDNDTEFSGETKRIFCDVPTSPADASSFSTVRTANVNRYDPIGDQNHRNVEWLYCYDRGSKDHRYGTDGKQYHDVPYYVHLPPHLGGERLFGDRSY